MKAVAKSNQMLEQLSTLMVLLSSVSILPWFDRILNMEMQHGTLEMQHGTPVSKKIVSILKSKEARPAIEAPLHLRIYGAI